MEQMAPKPQLIHITAIQIPVSYQAVLAVTPGLYARPPALPKPTDPTIVMPPPPPNGYDFMFHIGVAGRGPLRIEKLSHKFGYRMKDAEGHYAPTVHLPKEGPRDPAEASEVERMEQYLGLVSSPSAHGPSGDHVVTESPEVPPNRGFGKGYETFPEELHTDIDVPKLIVHLKEGGIEVSIALLPVAAARSLTIVQCACSKCTRPWTRDTTSATLYSTARSQRRSACRRGRRSSRTEDRRRRARRSSSCTALRSASHSLRKR